MSTPTHREALEPCTACGMPCTATEYHPYAACLMFKACHNSETVRANLNFVRASRPEPQAGEAVARFCPGCGSVGPVPDKYRDCCPDGSKARMIPAKLAQECHDLFQLAIRGAAHPPAGEAKLREALETIADWRLPPTGKFWDEEKTRPTSYEAEYGSNGAREYMRAVACAALSAEQKGGDRG